MSWSLLLIQLVPSIIKIIETIRDLLHHVPHDDRPAIRREMRTMARKHVRALSLAHADVAFHTDELSRDAVHHHAIKERAGIEAEWGDLLERVHRKVVA